MLGGASCCDYITYRWRRALACKRVEKASWPLAHGSRPVSPFVSPPAGRPGWLTSRVARMHTVPGWGTQCYTFIRHLSPSASLRLAPQCPAPAFGWHLSAQRHAGARFFFFTTGYHRSFFTHHNMPHRRSFPCPAPARTFTWGPGKGPVASGVPMRRSIFTCNASREGLLT